VNTNFRKTIGQITSALCVLFALCAAPACLRAGTITVTSAADSGGGTLRAALASANDGDTINFALPTPAKITLTSGELLVAKSVSILGPGATNLVVDGNAANRVLHIGSNTVVTITGLTITNGYASGFGFAVSSGGGIYNDHATLTVNSCALSGNYGAFGGGIFNDGQSNRSATVTVANSTLSGNQAGAAGAICNMGNLGGNASLQLLNSTISSNWASIYGGVFNNGVQGNASLHVLNSTFSGNSSEARNGDASIRNYQGSVTIGSTILGGGGQGEENLRIDSGGTITSLGYNLTTDWNGGGFLTNATDLAFTDPKLGPLQDNGGPTFTHAFICRSPAIDAGKNFSGSATDQRGSARTFNDPSAPNTAGGDGTDIGAFEAQQPLLVCDNPPVADASATIPLIISPNGSNATVILDGSRSSDPDGDALQYNWFENGTPLTSGVVTTPVLPVGTHTILLVVSDGKLSGTNALTVEVITAAEAVTRLVAALDSNVSRAQALAASLRAALASTDRSNPVSAIDQLLAFQNKVRALVEPLDSALAASLIQPAQEVIDALSGDNSNPGGRPHGRITSAIRQANCRVGMQFSAEGGVHYLIEATTNLLDWELIGVAGQRADGQFEFEDPQTTQFAQRFYRVRVQ